MPLKGQGFFTAVQRLARQKASEVAIEILTLEQKITEYSLRLEELKTA